MAKGQWTSLAMPKKYINHIPEMLAREENIRDFLEWFQALLTVNVEDFAKQVGIDPTDYKARYDEAKLAREKDPINEQFGSIHCSDPRSGVQPGTVKGQVCNKVNNCPTCEKRRSVFVMSASNVAHLLAWRSVLQDARARMDEEAFRPWATWLLFCDMMHDRIKKIHHTAAFSIRPNNGLFRQSRCMRTPFKSWRSIDVRI